MKNLLSAAAIAGFFAAPVQALTYTYDYFLGTSVGGTYSEIEDGSFIDQVGDLHVSGFVETDGTLGAITAEIS